MSAPISPAPAPATAPSTAPPSQGSAAPTSAGSSPAPAPAAPAADPTAAVNALLQQSKALTDAYATSIAQVKAAVALLGKNPKLSETEQGAMSRLEMIGLMLDDADEVKTAKPATLPAGANAEQVMVQAESSFVQAVTAAAKQINTVAQQMDPSTAPKATVDSFVAAQRGITDAMYAVRYAGKIVPAPAAPAKPAPTGTVPAPAPSTPAPSTPAPAATS